MVRPRDLPALVSRPWHDHGPMNGPGVSFDFDEERRAFRAVVDGDERWLPMLEESDFRGWHARHARIYNEFIENAADSRTLRDWIQTERLAEDQLVDAVLAYHRTGVLGTREHVEETFTAEQMVVIARRIALAHG
jgi:hypothetical protein